MNGVFVILISMGLGALMVILLNNLTDLLDQTMLAGYL